MEFLSQQPDDVRRRFALALREIPGVTCPDALLALLLRWEVALPPALHDELYAAVGFRARARAIDWRVLEIVARSAHAAASAACNSYLGTASAEWLAVRCIAGILPATSLAEWERNRSYRAALQTLIAARGLKAAGLAGQLLFREACPTDRRGAYAVLSAEGKAILRRMWPAYARGIVAYFARYVSEEEAGALTAVLGRVAMGDTEALRDEAAARG